MTLDEAKKFLALYTREECRDHVFGDAEVYWMDASGIEVASGYFGSDASEVTIPGRRPEEDSRFVEGDARELRTCGLTGAVTRNDSGGS